MTQTTLDFSKECVRKAKSPGLARMMIAYLFRCHGRWVTRKEFMSAFGWPDDRYVRAGREAANERIIYSQHGLKLMKDATIDECNQYLARCAVDRIAAMERERKAIIRFHSRRTMETINTERKS